MSIESRIDQLGLKNNVKKFMIEESADEILQRAEELGQTLTSDTDLRDYFLELKNKAKEQDPLIDVMSLVYIAAQRAAGQKWDILGHEFEWNMTPRKVQVMAGVALSDTPGDYWNIPKGENRFILERTGEGKTLVSLFPIAYHALFGKVILNGKLILLCYS